MAQTDDKRILDNTQSSSNSSNTENPDRSDFGNIILYIVFGVCTMMLVILFCVLAIVACRTDFLKNNRKKIISIIDFNFQSLKYNEEINIFKHTDCSICLEAFVTNCDVFKVKCGHLFHTKCIEEYDNSSKLKNIKQSRCPLCKIII